jgi:adenylate kinase
MNQSSQIRTVLFFGRPGSGKGTQARLLAEKTGFILLSTGERFRELREHHDDMGRRIRETYDSGKLLPFWLAEYMFEDALLKLHTGAGIVFEGSGRSKDEAERFEEVSQWLGRAYRVINLEVQESEAQQRQLSRAEHHDRPDSNSVEKIKVRFDEYNRSTLPALEFFRTKGLVIDIDGERSVETIHHEVLTQLGLA